MKDQKTRQTVLIIALAVLFSGLVRNDCDLSSAVFDLLKTLVRVSRSETGVIPVSTTLKVAKAPSGGGDCV